MKRLLFSLSLVAIVNQVPVAHASDIEISLKESVLKIESNCSNDAVTIELKSEEKTIYNSQVNCQDGSYVFRDDLSVWGIPEGTYQIVLNGKVLEQPLVYRKEKVPEHKVVSLGSKKEPLPKQQDNPQVLSFEGALAQFGESLGKLDESLLVIENEAQKNKSYADSLKGSLVSVMRDALGVLTGFFNDFQNASTEVNLVEESPSESSDQTDGAPNKPKQEELKDTSIESPNLDQNKTSTLDPKNVMENGGLQLENKDKTGVE